MRNFMIAGLTMLAVPSMAQAVTTYDLVADYGTSVFSYGAGDSGLAVPTFTPYTQNYASGCFGYASFTCKSYSSDSTVPSVGVSSSSISFASTVNLPANTLWTHPDNGTGGTDAVIRFTAPTASIYSLQGLFSRIDSVTSGSNDPGNNGVEILIYKTVAGVSSQVFSSNGLLGYGKTQGTSVGYTKSIALGANDSVSYAVRNNGVYYNDSTGLTGTIAAVPEPASWAMMVGGFGLLGFGMRASRRKAVLA